MRAHGVPHLIAHLKGRITLAEAAERSKLDTRHYAKRQFTWARRQMTGFGWVAPEEAAEEGARHWAGLGSRIENRRLPYCPDLGASIPMRAWPRPPPNSASTWSCASPRASIVASSVVSPRSQGSHSQPRTMHYGLNPIGLTGRFLDSARLSPDRYPDLVTAQASSSVEFLAVIFEVRRIGGLVA